MTEESKAAPPAVQPAASGTSSSSYSGPSGSPRAVSALTLKQQAVYDMKVAGKTRAEIAHILGISVPVVSKTLQACYKKLGLKKKAGGQTGPNNTGAEFRNPEVAAAAIEAAADPSAESQKVAIERINEQLKAAGVPGRVSEALLRRLRVKYANAVTATKELRTNEILEMLGQKLDLAAFYLDDKVMAEASARDLMLGMGVLIEKRNLLRGEPTAIISDHERKKLHELLPALIAEGKRRCITVEGTVTEKSVTNVP